MLRFDETGRYRSDFSISLYVEYVNEQNEKNFSLSPRLITCLCIGVQRVEGKQLSCIQAYHFVEHFILYKVVSFARILNLV